MKAKQLQPRAARSRRGGRDAGVPARCSARDGSWAWSARCSSTCSQSRLQNEYGVPVRYEPAPCEAARWVVGKTPDAVAKFTERNRLYLATDRDGALVYLPESEWMMRKAMEDFPDVEFVTFRERD